MKITIEHNGRSKVIDLTKEVSALESKTLEMLPEYTSYELVCAALGIDDTLPFPTPITKKEVSSNGVYKLETLFEAFNPPDFEPDYTKSNQYKYYPWHEYNPSLGRFVCTNTVCTCTYTGLGARLCGKTDTIATYVAKNFNKEWNEFLNPQI
jgi:hypothetical protein